MPPARPDGVPAHLPCRLTITLWDFTWYTRTAPGEPFDDLDRAFAEATERGYNTVRICAMPFLLFGDHGLDTTSLTFSAMGDGVGQGTRWYDVRGGATLDGRAHLRALFEAARRHDCYVILSSWEYQQSPAFLADSSWYDALTAVPPQDRHLVMARAMTALVQHLDEHGLADRIAYAELHNEVDLSRLAQVDPTGADVYGPQREPSEAALAVLRTAHPDVLATSCYGIPPVFDLDTVPDSMQVGHFHVYVYGVLGALESWAGVRVAPPQFPQPELVSLLRAGAPPVEEYAQAVPDWRLAATGVSRSMFYAYDWVDTAKWDLWLYENHHAWREWMRRALDDRLTVLRAWSVRRGVPSVIGEGWIGYTPLHAGFEDGPVGHDLAEFAVRRAVDLGYWGVVLGSNSAPHHPGWADVAWQQRWNRFVLAAGDSCE